MKFVKHVFNESAVVGAAFAMAILVMGLLCVSTVFAQGLPGEESLKLYMPFDNLSVADVSGNGNNGMPYGNISSAEDRLGDPSGAIYFDGNADWVAVPPNGIEFESFTIALWIKKDSIQSQGNGSGAGFPIFQRDKHYIRLESESNPLISGRMMALNTLVYDFPSNEWVHVAVSYGADGYQHLFIDGVLRDTAPYLPLPGAGPLHIGRQEGLAITNCFAGSLDDVMLFDRALDMAEIADLAEVEYEEPEECIPVSQIAECEECDLCFALSEEQCLSFCEGCPAPVVCPDPVVCEECFADSEEECLGFCPAPPECFADSEEECLDQCPVCEECPEPVVCETCPESSGSLDCEESTEIIDSAVRKAKLHFNKKRGITNVQLNLKAHGIPDGLADGSATIQLRIFQGDDVVEFTGEANLREHGHSLMDKKHKYEEEKKEKERKEKEERLKKQQEELRNWFIHMFLNQFMQ